ncbi:hypothetical protein CLOLEP_03419 [[Clostridium] leptum DSM 753]|uniref:Uncharacterized protein n=1 Tax=[Clostridium] leptum DSM 753 TaxID=428125 RepID=A7VXU3_9FIRM|nr:hypothetical protein CLOLEP_03419 [[Clostridium] leptum DSM 753]
MLPDHHFDFSVITVWPDCNDHHMYGVCDTNRRIFTDRYS